MTKKKSLKPTLIVRHAAKTKIKPKLRARYRMSPPAEGRRYAITSPEPVWPTPSSEEESRRNASTEAFISWVETWSRY